MIGILVSLCYNQWSIWAIDNWYWLSKWFAKQTHTLAEKLVIKAYTCSQSADDGWVSKSVNVKVLLKGFFLWT